MVSTKEKFTNDYIFTIRQIMEKYYEYDKDLYMIFLDLFERVEDFKYLGVNINQKCSL